MQSVTVIFNPYEKDVLLHALYKDHPRLQKIMQEIITRFEKTNYNKKTIIDGEEKTIIDYFIDDKESSFPPLMDYYENKYGIDPNDRLQKILLEAGIFYTIGKLLLIKCHYQKGMNKLMYASTLPELPERFTPLYLFRLGWIDLEQGMMTEAGDTLELAVRCCRRYQNEEAMKKLEELILYLILRVYIIKENLPKAKEIICRIKELTGGEESIIFSSLLGYYYRNTHNFPKALKILDGSYERYKNDEFTKHTFARSWFNLVYQRAFCRLETKDFAQATVLVDEACSLFDDANYRNQGYCDNLRGEIEFDHPKADMDKALEYFEKAYIHFEKYNDYRNMARVQRNIGKTYFKMKKYPAAGQAFNQSLAYDYRTQIETGIIRTLLGKIDLRVELSQYYKAREYMERIKELPLPSSHYLREAIQRKEAFLKKIDVPQKGFIGKSENSQKIKEDIRLCARSAMPALLLGERGVGKTMIAEMIHEQSGRKGEFQKINCAAIPSELLESELFGYLKGAFTDAVQNTIGILETANNGTVLLDEIGDLPDKLQVKLFQFIEEGTIRPLGSPQTRKLNVRIICATSKNLREEINNNRFRLELYDRISGLVSIVPPLRARKEDIRLLTNYFYVVNCKQQKKSVFGIDDDAWNFIENYPWPGNVRQMKNTIENCILKMEEDQSISMKAIQGSINPFYLQLEPIPTVKTKPENEEETKKSATLVSPELEQRIQRLENKLENILKLLADNPPGRITDRDKMVNELFRIIREHGQPIRKADIVKQCPALGKSFNHWIDMLKDEYQAISVDTKGNYKVYRAVVEGLPDRK